MAAARRLVAATPEQQSELNRLAYELHQIFQRQGRKPEPQALEDVSRWIDAHPGVRVDISKDPNEDDDDTHPLAMLVAISRHPASVAVYQKMVTHQPDILTKKFDDLTLVEHIQDVLDEIARIGGEGAGVLRQKLNPTLKADLALDRLFGKPGEDRKGNPLPRGVSELVREAVTGNPVGPRSATVRGGRRKSRRARKTRSRGRKGTRKTK